MRPWGKEGVVYQLPVMKVFDMKDWYAWIESFLPQNLKNELSNPPPELLLGLYRKDCEVAKNKSR